ncbi:unnamed protein product [Camellia sinensis]
MISGLSGTTETSQSQVSVGMGLLAGSTVVILTVIWGTCVIVGKCDLHDSIVIDGKDTKKFSLTGSGVTTDIWTSYAARIMVFQPWIQRRRLAYVKHKHIISGFLKYLKMRALGRFIKDNGELNTEIVAKLFRTIDGDKDGFISEPELKALIVGMRLDEISLSEDDAVKKVMNDFDTSNDYKIDLHEFINGISKWLDEVEQAGASSREAGPASLKYLDDFHKREHYLLGDQSVDQSDKVLEGVENPKWTSLKAVLMLVVGTVIAAVFADPLVDAVDNFSDAISIPSFFISFTALPLATSSSEAVSGIIFASRKRTRSASLTFSQFIWRSNHEKRLLLVGFLSFGLCLRIDVGLLRGSFGYSSPLVAFFLYPFSLALVYVLDNVLGWS